MAGLLFNCAQRVLSIVLIFSLLIKTSLEVGKVETKEAKNITTPVRETIDKKQSVSTEQIPKNTHNGREHVVDTSPQQSANSTHLNITKPMITNVSSSTRSNDTTLKVNIRKSTSTTTSTTTATTTKKVTKPRRTVHDEIELTVSKYDTDIPTLAHIDPTMDKKVRRADYVVPIVAVILSVPLVAILISVFYKRGKDWWQHRNYRRMDFLIEGMYNS